MRVACLSYAVAAGLLFALSSTRSVSGFYFPGVKPHSFKDGERVQLKVNALTSTHTQIPRDYYRLPFCQPQDGPKMASENLGEFLTGNKIQTSPYVFTMRENAFCQKLCQKTLDRTDAAKLRLHIKYGYHNNWIIDNLPSAAIGMSKDGEEKKRYAGGFPIGFMHPDDDMPYVYNHVNIHIQYHNVSDGNRVVGFAVEPLSVKHQFQGNYVWDGNSLEGFSHPLETCPNAKQLTRDDISSPQIVKQGEVIIYTYDVMWELSDIEWSSRWDVYLSEDHLVPAQVHWYSITNSILVVLFLSLLVVSVLVRNLRRDIDAYNALAALADEEKDDDVDETGWKLIHADVFRPPSTYPMLYCVFLGSGAQLCVATLHSDYCRILSGDCFWHIRLLQHHSLDHALRCVSSIFGCPNCGCYVVLRLDSAGVLGSLLWVQARSD
jgi:transmembrane 9 superfamily member 2/4